MEMDDLPFLDPATLLWLRERFPNTIPTDNVTPEELARLQGQQDVIRALAELEAVQIGQREESM